MQPDVQREVEHVVALANFAVAAMRRQDFDKVATARGLACLAVALVGEDEAARTALAAEMLRQVRTLDRDMITARWQ
jgi:hypothetical protein